MSATWFLCRLAVSGPPDDLDSFARSARGPGFVDWWPSFERATEHLPEAVAAPLRRVLVDTYRAGELAAARDPQRCLLDFASIIPVPDDVRRKGWHAAGRAWTLKTWGTAYQPAKIEAEAGTRRSYTETKHRGRGRLAMLTVPQVTYSFTAEGSAPVPIVDAIKARWPMLDVQFRALELEDYQADRRETVKAVYSSAATSKRAPATPGGRGILSNVSGGSVGDAKATNSASICYRGKIRKSLAEGTTAKHRPAAVRSHPAPGRITR